MVYTIIRNAVSIFLINAYLSTVHKTLNATIYHIDNGKNGCYFADYIANFAWEQLYFEWFFLLETGF